MIRHGQHSPWRPFFEALAKDMPVTVEVPGSSYSGEFSSVASWPSPDEHEAFEGVVITDDLAVDTWIPYDAIVRVELL